MSNVTNKSITTLLALAVLVTAGAGWAGVSFELLAPPREADWANFSLSRDGRNMGCVFGGSVYWWAADEGYRPLGGSGSIQGGVGMAADGNALIASGSVEGGTAPFIWFADGRKLDLGSLTQGCQDQPRTDIGFDISGDGSIAVGQATTCSQDEGFLWQSGVGIRELDGPGDTGSRAVAVSADGHTVVGYCDHPQGGYRRPALWRDGGPPHLFLGDDRHGEAHNISLDGRLVVGQAELGGLRPQAFYWTSDIEPVSLGSLSGRATDPSGAEAVSDDGKVVGWSGDDLWGEQEAFIWTAGRGMLSLRQLMRDHGVGLPPDLVLTSALDISGDGNTVVGVGRDRDWNPRYWRITLDGILESSPLANSSAKTTGSTRQDRPDTLDAHQADFLNPFPFGKRRFGPFQ